jgi:CheY-like chemotaxis protein
LKTMTSKDKPTILIVDDSRTVRVSLAIALRNDFTIIEAVDGEEGWKKLCDNRQIQLVISDILMPILDGYGFICRVRGAETVAVNEIPIIVITSKEDDLTRERAHACGANNFIVKPVATSDLLETVKFHTEHKLVSDLPHLPVIEQYQKSIEEKVLEIPDLNQALQDIDDLHKDALEPYVAIELAIKVLPLLEYCDKAFKMDVGSDLQRLKSKLKKA